MAREKPKNIWLFNLHLVNKGFFLSLEPFTVASMAAHYPYSQSAVGAAWSADCPLRLDLVRDLVLSCRLPSAASFPANHGPRLRAIPMFEANLRQIFSLMYRSLQEGSLLQPPAAEDRVGTRGGYKNGLAY